MKGNGPLRLFTITWSKVLHCVNCTSEETLKLGVYSWVMLAPQVAGRLASAVAGPLAIGKSAPVKFSVPLTR